MVSRHDGHDIQYCMSGVTTSQSAVIKDDGWVKVTGDIEVDRIDGDVYIYCRDCGHVVSSGEDGLAEDWEAE